MQFFAHDSGPPRAVRHVVRLRFFLGFTSGDDSFTRLPQLFGVGSQLGFEPTAPQREEDSLTRSLHELRIVETCPLPLNQPGTWWPEVLPEAGTGSTPQARSSKTPR